mgnify:FL=1
MNKYYKKNRKKILRKMKEKYESDADYREQLKKKNLERYHRDPDYREKVREAARERSRRIHGKDKDII